MAFQAHASGTLTRAYRHRFLLVVLTALAATVIPDFSIVMAFIGSVPSNIMVSTPPHRARLSKHTPNIAS